jgi:hypothetical protein
MAALNPVVGDQTSLNFDFHEISELGPFSGLIRANARVPPYQVPPTNTFDVGDLHNNRNNNGVLYQVRIDGGRRGTPGFEVTVSLAQANQQPLSVVLFFEPGVLAGRTGTAVVPVDLYNLGTVHEVRFVGHGGGGGHLYQHDPAVIDNPPGLTGPAAIQLKQRTARVILTTHGYVANDPALLDRMKTLLPAGSADRQLLDALGTLNFNWRAYFLVPAGMRPAYETTVIFPFWKMSTGMARAKPYHQLTTPPTAVNLDMEGIDQFRRRMICTSNMVGGVRNYGTPSLLLADTQGRRDMDRYSAVARVGHVRETQEYESFCGAHLAAEYPSMKVVRTAHPVLSKAVQFVPQHVPRPADQYIYLGYIRFSQAKRMLPRSGSIFLINWCMKPVGTTTYQFTGNSAFGMVLDLHAVPHSTRQGFTMALKLSRNQVQQYAGTGIEGAAAHVIHLEYVQNRQAEQMQLNAMSQLANMTRNPNVISLRSAALRLITTSAGPEDIRHGPIPPRNDPALMTALFQSYTDAANQLAGSPLMAKMTQNEQRLLMNTPSQIAGRSQAVQASLQSSGMRAVYALILALLINGHRFVVVIDDAADRSRAVHDFHNFLKQARTSGADPHRRIWATKGMLNWTTMDIQTATAPANVNVSTLPLNDTRNPDRQFPALAFKHMLDSLPEHDFCLDHTGAYFSAPANAAPAYRTPWEASLGSTLQNFFIARPAEGFHFFQDQAEVLNASIAPSYVRERLGRFENTMRALLPTVHVLFSNSTTAMTDPVKAAFSTAILVLGNTQRMVFPQVTGVLMSYPEHRASILLGDPSDQRPVMLASQGRNEASTTYNRMFWQTAEYAGVTNLTLP